jgi:hypothetical protein
MTSLVGEEYFTRPPRRILTWRQRLARFLRGELRRSKASKVPPISQAPPRLGPIGDDALAFDSGSQSLVGDFSSLKFDDRGSLKDFKLSFDVSETKTFAPASKDSKQKRPPRSSPTDTTRKHGQVPSLDLPKLDAEEGGFLDTWLKQSAKLENQEKASAKKKKEPEQRVKSMLDVDSPLKTQAPLASQPINGKAREPERTASTRGRSIPSGTNSPTLSYMDYAQTSKRKAGDYDVLSPPKVRSTDRKPVTTVTILPPTSVPSDRASISSSTQPSTYNTSTYNTNRYSLDLGSDLATTRSLSTASKRLSTGSMYSQQAQRLDYQRSGATKVVDTDAESIASTTSRRFEIKTNSLLSPMTKTSADAAAAAVSQTISRINSNSYIGAVPSPATAMPPPPRSVAMDGGVTRRSVTDTVKSIQKPDDRNPSRRFSQPAMRNSYVDPGTPLQLSRTPTPEAQQGAPEARPRRPSSRLSDRMSWLKDLEDPSKNSGRDYMFKKLEGGVAAKLAAFEKTKDEGPKTASGTPAIGRSRTNSNASRVPSSDMYSIELPTRLSRRTTAQDGDIKPGNVTDVVSEGFKKKLENLTGNLATKMQEQSGKESAPVHGPAAIAQAKRRIPQDVLDLIALSGVDQEVAINEYLQRGTLGKTKTWDHEELMKQLDGPETHSLLKEEKQSPKVEAQAAKEEIKKETIPEPTPKMEEQQVPVKKELPVEEPTPSPVKEEQKAQQATTQQSYPASQNGKSTGMSFVVNSDGDVTDLNGSVNANKHEDEQTATDPSFNAASLPAFGA